VRAPGSVTAVITCALLFLTTPLAAQRVVTIGWLGSGTPGAASQKAFERSLGDHGFQAKLEIRFAQGKPERLPELAMDLIRVKPDLILVADAVSTAAAMRVTATIPIVMAGASDPLNLGLIENLPRPGRNVTGVASPFGDEFAGKWLEFLRALRPGASRWAVLYNPEIPAARRRHEQIQKAGSGFGVEVIPLEVRRAEDFEQAFRHYKDTGANGLIVDVAPFIGARASKILEFAARDGVPTMWGDAGFVKAGGLISYGTDYGDVYRKAGAYAARILNGAKPGDLPVEQTNRFELVINMKTAKILGLAVPPSLLLRADFVIK
jgi:putative ABC transport system substrate-binding protein